MKITLTSIFLAFFKIGLRAWGGPAVQLNVVWEKFVEQEKLVTDEEFTRTLGLYQALPGP